jgi:hypothetical protein
MCGLFDDQVLVVDCGFGRAIDDPNMRQNHGRRLKMWR